MKVTYRNQRGFTLVEVLACLLIVTLVLLPVMTVLSSNKRQHTAVERQLRAKHLAQSKLEEIKAMNWWDFKTAYLDTAGDAVSPNPLRFSDAYQDGKYLTENDSIPGNDFTYRVRVWPSNNSLLSTIQVTVFYKEAGQEKWETLYTEKARR